MSALWFLVLRDMLLRLVLHTDNCDSLKCMLSYGVYRGTTTSNCWPSLKCPPRKTHWCRWYIKIRDDENWRENSCEPTSVLQYWSLAAFVYEPLITVLWTETGLLDESTRGAGLHTELPLGFGANWRWATAHILQEPNFMIWMLDWCLPWWETRIPETTRFSCMFAIYFCWNPLNVMW